MYYLSYFYYFIYFAANPLTPSFFFTNIFDAPFLVEGFGGAVEPGDLFVAGEAEQVEEVEEQLAGVDSSKDSADMSLTVVFGLGLGVSMCSIGALLAL